MLPIRARAGSVVVRSATPADVGFIRMAAKELFLAYGSYERYLEDWFWDRDIVTQVAALDDVTAGFAMLAVYPEKGVMVAELLAIGVSRAYQSRGVGGALLDTCLELASEAAEVRLSVADGNSRAQRLFASKGFRWREGIGVYPSGQRARFMVLRKQDSQP